MQHATVKLACCLGSVRNRWQGGRLFLFEGYKICRPAKSYSTDEAPSQEQANSNLKTLFPSIGKALTGTEDGKNDHVASRAGSASQSRNSRPGFSIYKDIERLRIYRRKRLGKLSVGLVPTMGALHEGHLRLIEKAAWENNEVLVSIFVNPTQFGVNEDLSSYPRTFESDMAKLRALNVKLVDPNYLQRKKRLHRKNSKIVVSKVTAVFAPTVQTMYPSGPPSSEEDGDGSFVTITPLGKKLEGRSRPVFFRGVATVCTKLINIVQPTRIYFGQKDIQQSILIKRMVKDLHMDTIVRISNTKREDDGLAMSSRNVFLGDRRRQYATILYQALRAIEETYMIGVTTRKELLDAAIRVVTTEQAKYPVDSPPFLVDYISIADVENMDEIQDRVDAKQGAIVSGAVFMYPVKEPETDEERAQGTVRLIDNIRLQPREVS